MSSKGQANPLFNSIRFFLASLCLLLAIGWFTNTFTGAIVGAIIGLLAGPFGVVLCSVIGMVVEFSIK